MPSLLVLETPVPTMQGLWLPVCADVVVLGRIPGAGGVVLDCPPQMTSRTHSRIVRDGDEYFIEDMNSRNGTFVNDLRVRQGRRVPLRTDDILRVGSYTLLYSAVVRGGQVDASAPVSATPWPADGDDSTYAGESAAGVLVFHSHNSTRMFLRVSVELNRVTARGPLVERASELLLSAFPLAAACHVLLLDPAGRLHTVATHRRPTAPPDAEPRLSLAWQAIANHRAQITRIDHAPPDPDPLASGPLPRWGLFAPLLAADGRPLGVIELDGSPSATFTPDDLDLIAAVAGLCAVAVERVRLQEQLNERQRERQDVALARNVQLALLPQTAPRLAGYDFFAAYSPARAVGGDYYDYIPLPGGRLAVLLGDVAGKGVAAALMVAKLSSEARYCLLTERTPADAIDRLNDRLLDRTVSERFVTLALCVIDPRDHTVTLVNAGHPSPLVYRADANAVTEAVTINQSGGVIGLFPTHQSTPVTFTLGPSDFVVMYTDGVTDASNPEGDEFGTERVTQVLETARPPRVRVAGNRLIQAVQGHARGHPQTDDIAVVGFGRHQRADDEPESGITDVDLHLTEWAGG